MPGSLSSRREKILVLALPVAFLLAFVVIPLLNVFYYSLWSLDPVTGLMKPSLTLKNYIEFFSKTLYLEILRRTAEITVLATAIGLVVAYPIAYYVAILADKTWQPMLLFLIILPFWSSLLIRTFSWMTVLRENGFLDRLLLDLGLVSAPLSLLYSKTAVVIGLVHVFLPFMILPIYASLRNLDLALLEAARDLGATPLRAFVRVTLPLSLPGVAAGVLLFGLPAFGAFITPKLLGGTGDVMIGNVIEIQFKGIFNWPLGASVAALVTVLMLAGAFVFRRVIGVRPWDAQTQ
jgi:ABC-type spermidine/putrescine transport system permease subunit I